MRPIMIIAAIATAVCTQSPVFAGERVCHIILPTGGWSTEMYQHEMAHCNGWTHPKVPPGKRAYEVKNYRAPIPPPELTHLYAGPIEIQFLPPKKAIKACDRLSFACAFVS